jgi:hypothetical protein
MSGRIGSHEVSVRSKQLRLLGGRVRARNLVVAGMLSVGALTGVAGLGLGTSSAAGTSATAARTISLNETGHLRRTSSHGLKLNEQGSVTGTIRGTIYIHLNLGVAPNRVTAEVNIYPSGGSLSGSGSASYSVGVDGGTGNFNGTLSIDRGSGSYNHAHGSGLHFSGTIQRLSGAVTVHLSGSLST